MKFSILLRVLPTVAFFALLGTLIFSCGKTGNAVIPTNPTTTCVNLHQSLGDSICNMAGNRPSNQHHWHYEWDSGKLVVKTVKDTNSIYFTIAVSSSKVVSYNNYAYTLIDSNNTVFHFVNYAVPTDNHADIFYYPVKDSFVIATVTNNYMPQITQTDLDTLTTYW